MTQPARRLRLPHLRARYLFAAWFFGTLAWLAWYVEAVGGRPLTFIVADDPGMYDPQATSDPRAEHVAEMRHPPAMVGNRGVHATDDLMQRHAALSPFPGRALARSDARRPGMQASSIAQARLLLL